MRALWLVNQVWFIVPVNPWKFRVSSKLLNNSNTPQVFMVVMLEELRLVIYKFFSCSSNIPRGLSAYKP